MISCGVQGMMPDHVLVAGNQLELVRGFCSLGSHVEAGWGSGPEVRWRVAIARDCMSSLQRGIWKTGIRIDTNSVCSRRTFFQSSLWRRNLDTHQSPGDEAGCLPTLVSQADPASSLLGSHYKCGHLPACGADPGVRDGSK